MGLVPDLRLVGRKAAGETGSMEEAPFASMTGLHAEGSPWMLAMRMLGRT